MSRTEGREGACCWVPVPLVTTWDFLWSRKMVSNGMCPWIVVCPSSLEPCGEGATGIAAESRLRAVTKYSPGTPYCECCLGGRALHRVSGDRATEFLEGLVETLSHKHNNTNSCRLGAQALGLSVQGRSAKTRTCGGRSLTS